MLVTYFHEFLPLYAFHIINLLIPGPSFVIIIRHSTLFSRQVGVMTAAGMMCSGLLNKTLAVLGLGLLVRQHPWLFTTLKMAGGAHMLYLSGVCFWNGYHSKPMELEKTPLEKPKVPMSLPTAFRIGFLVNFLSPRSSLNFMTVLAVMVSPKTPLFVQECYVIIMMITCFFWEGGLAILFSNKKLNGFFIRWKKWLEYISGALMFFWSLALLKLA